VQCYKDVQARLFAKLKPLEQYYIECLASFFCCEPRETLLVIKNNQEKLCLFLSFWDKVISNYRNNQGMKKQTNKQAR